MSQKPSNHNIHLLLQGAEGVQLWNAARLSTVGAVNLDGADLSKLDLRGVDLHEASLVGANLEKTNLSGANLFGANLEACDFKAANLVGADLRATKGVPDVSHADCAMTLLDGAAWNEVDLHGVQLRGASLRGAQLGQAKSLTAAQLCGTDVTGASLPDCIAMFESLKPAEDAAKNCRGIFYLMLGACAYSLLTVASTSDLQLLANSDTPEMSLPLIGTKVPVLYFYRSAPIVLLGCMVYFHLYLRQLWIALARLPAVFPDGRTLDERAYPWLMVVLVRRCLPRLAPRAAVAYLQEYASIVLGWCLVPITLVFVWMRFLDRQEHHDSVAHVICTSTSVLLAVWFWTMMHDTFRAVSSGVEERTRLSSWRWFTRQTTAARVGWLMPVVTATVMLALTFSLRGQRGLDVRLPPFASERPDNYFELSESDLLKAVKGPNFWGRRMPGLSAASSFLLGANFQYTDLRWANLLSADLRGANFACANLSAVMLGGAQLQHADLHGAFVSGPRPANFGRDAARRSECHTFLDAPIHSDGKCRHQDHVAVGYAVLVNADLRYAGLRDTMLHFAVMESADLRYAKLRSAQLQGADLQHADLRHAEFNNVGFQLANLKFAKLQGARFDLGSAVTLGCADLSGAEIDSTTIFPEGFDRSALKWIGIGNPGASPSDAKRAKQ